MLKLVKPYKHIFGGSANVSLYFSVRNKDLTWPEEMSQLAKNKTIKKDQGK